MKNKLLAILLCLLIFNVASGQVYVKKWGTYGPIPLKHPILTDSTDIFGDKLTDTKLLQSVQLKNIEWKKYNIIEVEELIINESTENNSLYLCRFNLDADQFTKAKLSIVTSYPFEVYVNSSKLGGRTSADTSTNLKPVKLALNIEPRRYDVVVKLLVNKATSKERSLKVAVDADEKKQEAAITLTAGSQKRKLSIYDILEGERPTSVSISPNGKYVLQTFSTTYEGGKTTSRRSEVRDFSSNKLLMSDNGCKNSLQFTPGSKLCYTKMVDKTYSLYTIDPETLSEILIAEQLPSSYFSWSPDESYILIFSDEQEKIEKQALRRIINPEDRQEGWRKRWHISKYEFATGVMQRLTFGYHTIEMEDISNDSKYILFKTTDNIFTERPFKTSNLYLLNVETMAVDTILQNEKFIKSSQLSPNGKQVLVIGAAEAFGGLGISVAEGQTPNTSDAQAYLIDIVSKKIEAISKQFNPSIKWAVWSTYDNNIYFNVADADRTNMYSYNPQNKKYTLLPLTTDNCTGFSLAKNGPAAVYIGQTGSHPARTFKYDLKLQKSEVAADPLGERMAGIELPQMKDWNFTSSDGTTITGRYYLPLNFDNNKKYPMIVYFYGGTTPVDRVLESRYPLHLYATMGYVVYLIQPSGAIGFGQEFSARHVNAWGIRTAEDIVEGVQQFTKEHPYVDKSKVGCIGASYGGFMTQYLQTKTDIFAAAVSHAGISSLSSYWGEGYWGYTYSASASANSYPWNNSELYVEQSPLFHADKINTPLLFLHGGADTNVPIGESIQMFTALKLLGKTTEFIQVEGENHAIVDYEKRIEWNNSIFAWFARLLKDEPQWWNTMYPTKAYE